MTTLSRITDSQVGPSCLKPDLAEIETKTGITWGVLHLLVLSTRRSLRQSRSGAAFLDGIVFDWRKNLDNAEYRGLSGPRLQGVK